MAVKEEGNNIKVTLRPLVGGPTPSPGPELQNGHGAVAGAHLVRLSGRDVSALMPASPTGAGERCLEEQKLSVTADTSHRHCHGLGLARILIWCVSCVLLIPPIPHTEAGCFACEVVYPCSI